MTRNAALKAASLPIGDIDNGVIALAQDDLPDELLDPIGSILKEGAGNRPGLEDLATND